MIPRVGEPVRSGIKYRIRPGAYAILVRNGRILLTHQNAPTPEFQLPGGGIDPGEQMVFALHREILEETGWRATGLRRIGAFRRFTFMPEYDLWAEKICHVFCGRPTCRVDDPAEPDHTAIWTIPELAHELVGNEGDRLFLRRVFGQ
ncbi:MAG: NUDIX domain-containing protein [Paracoccaceae bacterium]